MENLDNNGIANANANTPSKLRPPKQRKNIDFDHLNQVEEASILDMPIVQQKGPESPKVMAKSQVAEELPPRKITKNRMNGNVNLPVELPQPLITTDRLVKTYKTSAAATGRPAPITKPITRTAPRTAAVGKPSIPRILYDPSASIMSTTGAKPAWDKSGRLNEMSKELETMKMRADAIVQQNSTAATQLTVAQNCIILLEDEKRHLTGKLSSKEREIDDLHEEMKRVKRKLENEVEERDDAITKMKNKLQEELTEVIKNRDKLAQDLGQVKAELAIATETGETLKALVSRQSSSQLESEAQIKILKQEIESLMATCSDREEKVKETKGRLESVEELLVIANKKLRDGETQRRRLHNIVQELKGNIRVFCRIRPLLPGEGEAATANGNKTGTNDNDNDNDNLSHIKVDIDNEEKEQITLLQSTESALGNQVSKSYPFTFDKVFACNSTQAQVFDEISQLVQSALDGYRVCIFAYGQTGSGKTFTMEGDMSALENIGMIPRAVEQIFVSTEALGEKGWTFTFKCSYLEIYNETIRDLLGSKTDGDTKYEIKHHENNTYVTELTVAPVSKPGEILQLLQKAATNRAVAETQCNERSSRSHSVFTLQISGNNGITTEKIDGLLHLVDLAGSERLSQSGSSGDRLKETQAINKSLSSLGDVIHSIANKESHIPYRNSKLTFLLQNSLGGNCKTLMFVNVNPSLSSFNESLCSLRFATKVNSCQIGTATKKSK